HQQPVSDLHLLEGDVDGRAVVLEAVGDLWSAPEQGGQALLGPARGVVLERLAAGEHQAHDQCGDVLADQDRGQDGGDSQDVDAPVAAHQVLDHAYRDPGHHHESVG